ncbi:MAG: DUF5916 domain-containing protein [Flavobacteriales bacterium]
MAVFIAPIKNILVVFVCFCCCFANAQDSLKHATAVRTSAVFKIDGVMDEEGWAKAISFSDFVMSRPKEGGFPKVKTEISILYDDHALYVGAMMYDDSPDSILHELGMRDDYGLNADLFRFVIDPYNIRQDAFEFGVYASGVQYDWRFSDGTFNSVWASGVKINDRGWCVELKIPYSAIRFPEKPVQEWAMQVTRNVRRTQEFDQWSLTPSGVANGLLYWGVLDGIENIKPPVRLSLMPYVSGYAVRAPEYTSATDYNYQNAFSYKVGADLKYGIDDRFTLDLTLLPDFGQVQTDNKVKNLTFQEVMYDEYRQFFKEGTDLFSKNNLFYSRRIGRTPSLFYDAPYMLTEGETLKENPAQTKLLNAAKVSGRTNSGLGIGLFNAITANTFAVATDSLGNDREILTEPVTNYNILVFDQQFKNNSSVWFINTNTTRAKKWDDSNLSGTGFSLALAKNRYAVDGAFTLSQVFKKTDTILNSFNTTLGHKYFIGARKTSGRFQFGASRSLVSQSFYQLDLGPFTSVNYENTRVYAGYYTLRPNGKVWNAGNDISFDYSRNPVTKKTTGVFVNYSSNITLLNWFSIFWGAGVTPVSFYDYNEPRIWGRYNKTLRYWYAYAGMSSDQRKKMAADANINVSNFIDRFVSEGYNTSVGLRYRFNDKFTLRYNWVYNYDPYNFGAVDWYTYPDTVIFGTRITNTYINSVTGRYIFNNNMAVSLIARHYWFTAQYNHYYTLEHNGEITERPGYPYNNDVNYNAFSIDLVYTWQFAPGSFLTLAYKNNIETQQNLIPMSFGKNMESTIASPQLNSLSLRVIYFLDYLYLKRKKQNIKT